MGTERHHPITEPVCLSLPPPSRTCRTNSHFQGASIQTSIDSLCSIPPGVVNGPRNIITLEGQANFHRFNYRKGSSIADLSDISLLRPSSKYWLPCRIKIISSKLHRANEPEELLRDRGLATLLDIGTVPCSTVEESRHQHRKRQPEKQPRNSW